MNRQSRGSAFSQARLALLIGAVVVPTLLSAQEPLWGGDLVSRIDSLAESTLAGGPVAGPPARVDSASGVTSFCSRKDTGRPTSRMESQLRPRPCIGSAHSQSSLLPWP